MFLNLTSHTFGILYFTRYWIIKVKKPIEERNIPALKYPLATATCAPPIIAQIALSPDMKITEQKYNPKLIFLEIQLIFLYK